MVTLQTCSTVLLLLLLLTMYCNALHFGPHQAQLPQLFCTSLHMVLLSHNVQVQLSVEVVLALCISRLMTERFASHV